MCAQLTPIWISGPSLPSAKPHPTTSAKPIVFISRVIGANARERSKPIIEAFVSGIPEPFHNGAYSITMKQMTQVQITQKNV